MKKVYTFIDKFSLLGAYLASVLLVSLVGLILTEIFLRSVFDKSTMIADEYSGYLYLASIFLGLAYTFKEDGHIRINILTSRLGKKSNRFIDICASFIAIVVLCFAFYRTVLFTLDSYEMEMVSEAVSETPLYLTQFVMPVGILLFIFAILSVFIKGVNYKETYLKNKYK